MSDLPTIDDLLAKGARPDTPDSPSWEDDLSRRARHEIEFRNRLAKPAEAGRANQLSRETGVPQALVRGNLPAFEQQERARKFGQLLNGSTALTRWASDPRNAEVAADDVQALSRIKATLGAQSRAATDFANSDGFLDRMGDLFNRAKWAVGSGTTTFRAALQEWSANNPLPWTSSENIERERRAAAEARAIARISREVASTVVAGETTWEQVKGNPSRVGGFILDQAAGSIPEMAMAALAAPLLVATKSGSIGADRADNDGRDAADIGDVATAAPAALAATMLDRLGLESILFGGGKTALKRIGAAAITEGATEFAQSGIEYAGGSVGTVAGFDPSVAADQGFAGLVGGVGMGTGTRGGVEVARPAVRVLARRMTQANTALANQKTLDGLMDSASQSETRKNDPEAFRALMEELAGDSDVTSIYVSADAMNSYMQSDGYEGEFDSFRDAVDDGLVTGGDVVVPVSTAATDFAGTPAWDAIRGDVRVTAGGSTPSEAEVFNVAMADVLDALTQQIADRDTGDGVRGILAQSLTEKLQNAGFTPHTARINAELLAQRAEARAARMGGELTGAEFDNLTINQVLPASLASAQNADQLDIVVNAMRGGQTAEQDLGPSLVQWIRSKGGIEDRGGDLTAIGFAPINGVSGKGRVKLLRDYRPDQASMLGSDGQQNSNSPDELAMRAWEAGYFPEFAERPSVDDMITALAEANAGRDRFAMEPSIETEATRAAANDLRALLDEEGVDPDTASMRQIREAVDRYRERQVGGVGFDQAFSDGPRGRITFSDGGFDGNAVIELFQSRNQSTFLHEAGHLWLEELRYDAAALDAPQQLKDDWQAVQDWFAANGNPLQDGVIPVDAHEMWARAVERYLMEGKVPSPALQRVFETIKSWMVNIYRTVAKLNTPITDDVRAVMDRLIATDEELAMARDAQVIEASLTERPASMSDGEWDAYQGLVSTERDLAQSKMLAKVMAPIRKRVTKEYRERRKGIEAEVTESIDSRPLFRALRQVQETPLDRGWIIDIFGADALEMMPKLVPPSYKAGGADPNEVAEIVGFKSADELLRALMGAEMARRERKKGGDKRSLRDVTIKEETDARMLELYGDPFTDGSIEEEALTAVHNDAAGEVMAMELRVLARSTRNRPTAYSVAKTWAAKTIREGRVGEVASRSAIQRYRRAASKAGREVQDAILARDNDAAFRAKQAQMLNNALLAEAGRVADEVDAAVKRLSNWGKRRTVKSVDQDYLERAQSLLASVAMAPRSQKFNDRRDSFEAWSKEQAALGIDIAVPPSFAAAIDKTHWSRLSVDHLLGLDDAVKQIIHLGRKKQEYLDNKEARDRDELIAEAESKWGDNERKPPDVSFIDPGFPRKAKNFVLGADAAMMKAETAFYRLDRSYTGVFNRVVFQPLVEAQERRRVISKDVMEKLEAARMRIPDEIRRRWRDKVTLPFTDPQTGQPAVMTRDGLISMALNMGNRGNAEKLSGGYGWNEQEILALLNRELTIAEWTFVQETWDVIDTLRPDLFAMERRVNGVEPEVVEPRRIETKAGVLKGGYYPVVYDPKRSKIGEQSQEKSIEKLFEGAYRRASTRSGATQERTEVQAPVYLSLSVLSRHVHEVVHDITHREAVIDAYRFLNEPRIEKLVKEVLNEQIYKQFNPWLQHIANEYAYDNQGMDQVEALIKGLRVNATFVGMAYRASTIVMQFAGLFNSAERVGSTWVASAAYRFAKNPVETWAQVREKSNEVAGRLDNYDRDIRDAITREQAKLGGLSRVKEFGFHMIGFADRYVSIVTWAGAYDRAISEGMSEASAVANADKAVRQSQGSGAAKDLAAIQRGKGRAGEASKLLTMFYSYQSAFYQRQRILAWDMGDAFKQRDMAMLPELLARTFLLYFWPAVAAELLAGRWPEDDEDWSQWAYERVTLAALGPIPVVRDVAGGIASGFGYNFTPASSAGRTVVNVYGDIGKILEGEETKRATRNAMEMAGYATGFVPGQLAASTQFLVDVAHGDADPETFGDWWEGLTKGRIKE